MNRWKGGGELEMRADERAPEGGKGMDHEWGEKGKTERMDAQKRGEKKEVKEKRIRDRSSY